MTYNKSCAYRYVFWLAVCIIIGLFLYYIRTTLFPFITAIVFAYFLDPLVAKLENKSLSRTNSSAIIVCVFFLIITLVCIIVTPLIYEQLLSFIHKIPEYRILMQEKIIPIYIDLLGRIDHTLVMKVQNLTQDFSGRLFQYLNNLLTGIWQSGLAIANFLFLIFITPIITFYLLRDWPVMISTINKLLPISSKKTIKQQAHKIDFILSGYIRGQMNVCFIMAIFYSISLSLLGLDFGLFIGGLSGLLTLIPLIGPIIGFISAILLALLQSMCMIKILILCFIFILGPMVEGNFITPKLVGERVGLHPAWIIFAVLASTNIAGFTGMLIAVPAAAIIGVLIRFMIQQYLSSNFSK